MAVTEADLPEGVAPFGLSDEPESVSAVGCVGPARRATVCAGRCWEPNRYGRCKVCGGDAPQARGSAVTGRARRERRGLVLPQSLDKEGVGAEVVDVDDTIEPPPAGEHRR